jgi:hypothetical protein
MRWLLGLLLLGCLSLVRGLSSSGDRLLVVIEEAAEQSKYSLLWSDLKGASYLVRAPLKSMATDNIYTQIGVIPFRLSHRKMKSLLS